VKSIVEELKQRERSEYQEHKTLFYPWGTSTVLEMNDDCTVEKLNIYPGSEVETQTDVSTRKHLVVMRGTAKMTLDNQSRRLNIGESVRLSENQRVILENAGKEPLHILIMTLDF
jgi:mannose-6-phosphate isomerase-like protein (cupin superfamily)